MSYERFYFWINDALVELPENNFRSGVMKKMGIEGAPCCDTDYVVKNSKSLAWGHYNSLDDDGVKRWNWKGQTKAEMPPEFLLQLMLIGVPI